MAESGFDKKEVAYKKFLESKLVRPVNYGFRVDSLNEVLFDFQQAIVRVALEKGRFAIFADCGLGKTLMQLEWAYRVFEQTTMPVLILAPLAVVGQTIKEAARFGYDAGRYGSECPILISNYENLDNIDCDQFSGVVLDESSILKNFEGEYKKLIIECFKTTPFKLACTATPSPNDDMEICNHAEFLAVGKRSEILATYFTHDGGETAKWRLKGHAVDKFWQFVSSWSIMVSNPSDIGFDGSKYILPEINYLKEEIKTVSRDDYKMYNDVAVSATNFNQELRNSFYERLDRVAEIVNGSDENFIIWIKQNEEGEYLRKLIQGSIEVKGTDSQNVKEKHLLGFGNNDFKVLITKTKIAQFGLNYQNCRNQIFASLDFSFEGLYQAIRRSYRFGQKNEVNIYLITTDTMQNVIAAIKRKENQFKNMKSNLTKYVKL
jgi:hypothetical protein